MIKVEYYIPSYIPDRKGGSDRLYILHNHLTQIREANKSEDVDIKVYIFSQNYNDENYFKEFDFVDYIDIEHKNVTYARAKVNEKMSKSNADLIGYFDDDFFVDEVFLVRFGGLAKFLIAIHDMSEKNKLGIVDVRSSSVSTFTACKPEENYWDNPKKTKIKFQIPNKFLQTGGLFINKSHFKAMDEMEFIYDNDQEIFTFHAVKHDIRIVSITDVILNSEFKHESVLTQKKKNSKSDDGLYFYADMHHMHDHFSNIMSYEEFKDLIKYEPDYIIQDGKELFKSKSGLFHSLQPVCRNIYRWLRENKSIEPIEIEVPQLESMDLVERLPNRNTKFMQISKKTSNHEWF